MKLSDFIRTNLEPILDAWEQFAADIPSAKHMSPAAMRDHARGMLTTIAADLDTAQSPLEQVEKSLGLGPQSTRLTAAQRHGADRGAAGFSETESFAEFRALRATVTRLWAQSSPDASPSTNEDLVRFNESIDQALAESVARYSSDKERTIRLFEILCSTSDDLKFILETDGTFIYANHAMAELYGIAMGDVPRSNIAALGGPIADIDTILQLVVETRQLKRVEIAQKDPGGALLIYEYLLAPVLDPQANVEAIIGRVRNITEHKAHEENIRRIENVDTLTGLPNRSVFRDRLEQQVKRSDRNLMPMAVLFIDLDDFKVVNDRLGHDAGDMLLQQAALRIGSCIRGTDTVARLGGDEFTVILVDIGDLQHIDTVAQKILDELARPFTVRGHDLNVSASIGITVFPLDAATSAALIGNADQAMYEAKRAGRNRFSYYSAELREAAWTRRKLLHELRHALGAGELCVHYQPIVELAHGTILKAEALLRWQHPTAGLMLAGSFIGLAEEAGLIAKIDEWVLGEAVERAREWSTLLGTQFQIGVNNSPSEFLGNEPMQNWDAHLARLRSTGDGISVEVTEGTLEHASPLVIAKLHELHDAGVKLAIDRFGTGSSSMARLKEFGVDTLKIDKSLVGDALGNVDQQAVAEAAIVMAHMLGLKVVADGVESVQQRDWLQEAGCDYAQGYYFSAPVPSGEFATLLGQRNLPPALHS